MKRTCYLILLLIAGLSRPYSAKAQVQTRSIFTDSLPDARVIARSSKFRPMFGAWLQWRMDGGGESLNYCLSRIGRKWAVRAGLIYRLPEGIFYDDFTNRFPGIIVGTDYYPNRFHGTFVPFFHAEMTFDEALRSSSRGLYMAGHFGYGNRINISQYLYLDCRVGVGYSRWKTGYMSAFGGVGFGFNWITLGKDLRGRVQIVLKSTT